MTAAGPPTFVEISDYALGLARFVCVAEARET